MGLKWLSLKLGVRYNVGEKLNTVYSGTHQKNRNWNIKYNYVYALSIKVMSHYTLFINKDFRNP